MQLEMKVTTISSLHEWVRKAKHGDEMCYHRGHTCLTFDPVKLRHIKSAVATEVYTLAENGKLFLFKKRDSTGTLLHCARFMTKMPKNLIPWKY